MLKYLIRGVFSLNKVNHILFCIVIGCALLGKLFFPDFQYGWALFLTAIFLTVVAIPFIIELLTKPIHSPKDIQRVTGCSPLVMTYVLMDDKPVKRIEPLLRGIFDKNEKVYQVLSVSPGAGKSLLSCSLAEHIASLGYPVRLFDTDTKRRSSPDYIALLRQQEVGYTISGTVSLETAFMKINPDKEEYNVVDYGPFDFDNVAHNLSRGKVLFIVNYRRISEKDLRKVHGLFIARNIHPIYIFNKSQGSGLNSMYYYESKNKNVSEAPKERGPMASNPSRETWFTKCIWRCSLIPLFGILLYILLSIITLFKKDLRGVGGLKKITKEILGIFFVNIWIYLLVYLLGYSGYYPWVYDNLYWYLPKHGVFRTYYSDNKMKDLTTWKYGETNGNNILWNEQGQKLHEGTLRNKIREGYWFVWNSKEQAMENGPYRNDMKNGKWIEYNEHRKIETEYLDDKKNGKQTLWYSSGQKAEESEWKDDQQNGRIARWYESGNKRLDGEYKSGLREGHWIWYYENGNKESEIFYIDGRERGTVRQWNTNGQLETEKIYNDNGELVSIIEYKDGKPVKEQEYKSGKLVKENIK